ncbi:hypothetical protein C8R46DRAFT_1024361 [Mycena filopes]|nr:hypothetical protein C8R46DRAFT_1024361 [Mycena filopes]
MAHIWTTNTEILSPGFDPPKRLANCCPRLRTDGFGAVSISRSSGVRNPASNSASSGTPLPGDVLQPLGINLFKNSQETSALWTRTSTTVSYLFKASISSATRRWWNSSWKSPGTSGADSVCLMYEGWLNYELTALLALRPAAMATARFAQYQMKKFAWFPGEIPLFGVKFTIYWREEYPNLWVKYRVKFTPSVLHSVDRYLIQQLLLRTGGCGWGTIEYFEPDRSKEALPLAQVYQKRVYNGQPPEISGVAMFSKHDQHTASKSHGRSFKASVRRGSDTCHGVCQASG